MHSISALCITLLLIVTLKFHLIFILQYSTKNFNRCCCCDNRCAFPCDKEVPCVFTVLPGCVLCVNGQCAMACCEKLEKLKIDHVAGYVPNPPAGAATAATRQPMQGQTVTAQPM